MIVNDNHLLSTVPLTSFAANAPLGTAAATVDIASSFVITQAVGGIVVTIPAPTDTTAGLELNIANAAASTQNITVGGYLMIPSSSMQYRWTGASWVFINAQGGIRNMGASVLVAAVTAGNSVVTHNLTLPATFFSSVIFRAYNAAGNEVMFKRNKAADTTNVIGISSPIALTNITFDIVSLA